jgi:hypothetical protein
MPSDQCHQGPLQFVSSSESYTTVKREKEAWEITKLQLYDYTPKASLLLQVSNMNLPKNPNMKGGIKMFTNYWICRTTNQIVAILQRSFSLLCEFQDIFRENLPQDTVFSVICRNTLFNCGFARTHSMA